VLKVSTKSRLLFDRKSYGKKFVPKNVNLNALNQGI